MNSLHLMNQATTDTRQSDKKKRRQGDTVTRRNGKKGSFEVLKLGSWEKPFLYFAFFVLVFPFFPLYSLEVPLEFHGKAFLGKYLNSDTTLYNMEASIGLYCTILRQKNFSLFMHYQDDLDMAEQKGGVSLDPRYAHYYIVCGIDYLTTDYLLAGYFMHDCIHDIDYEIEGTPVFNRFRLQIAHADFHYSKRLHGFLFF